MPLLWMIDDAPGNLAVAAATLAQVPGWEFAGHDCGAAGVAAFRGLRDKSSLLPDVVLIDFYLGDTTGDQVARHLRAAAPRGWGGRLIGHSSVPAMSRAIVSAGAHLILPKHQNEQGINPSLLSWLQAYPQVC